MTLSPISIAFLIAAEDRKSTTPKRLLHDHCPAWRKAFAELYPPRETADPGDTAVNLIGTTAWCRDDGCDQVTRILVYPDTGYPLPGRRRCPRCHPQSPAPAAPGGQP